MFRKINDAEVWSDSGFKVRYGKNSLTYKTDNEVIIVDIEHMVSPYQLVIFHETLSEIDKQGERKHIDSIRSRNIIDKIKESLDFLQIDYDID